jgi:hypothetical protein
MTRRDALALLPLPILGTAAVDQRWLITDADFRERQGLKRALDRDDVDSERSSPPRPARSKGIQVLVDSEKGPRVKIERPASNRVENPVDLKILFEAKDRPVNLGSLRLRANKEIGGMFSGDVDLIPRVRKYLSEKGIDARGYQMPKGLFRIALSICDIDGNESRAHVILDVVS